MEILVNIWHGVTDYWRLVAEISILSVAIYYTLKFFRGTRGWPMVVALLGLIGATLLCAALKLTVLSALLTSLFAFSAVAVLVIFQPELRRLLAGRLLGMVAEGVLTGTALAIGGVPMAMILGILTGLLAFIPNIGAFISGALLIAVGFSAGTHVGFWAIGTYVIVQGFDGYVLLPIVAKKTVDLPPALTLGAQIMASALFGILGLALADPMTAMVKTALERSAERESERDDGAEG